ncbi:MAG TPA: VCBS repeat-containing protein, partial [Polyangiaceae bacterium]
ITLAWTGTGGGGGGGIDQYTSTFVDLDGAADGHLELLAGNTAYKSNGAVLWNNAALPDGFPGVGDFDKDGKPDPVLVANGKVWVLDGLTGAVVLGPATLPGTGSGGPPTVADFDGSGAPQIGVAMATFYSVMKPNYATKTLDVLWKTPNHDLSSSVTGSTVFDFEGDGKAEVIYGDECFLWVFNGQSGAVRFAAPHTSFTATEASLLADVDGDGHAEMVMVSNGADPSSAGWGCMDAAGKPGTVNGVTWAQGPTADKGYRGLVVFGDSADSWVGTRTLWSEHTYHVSNICDDRDTACPAPNVYGSIPKGETRNWTLPWLNDFRQNVQDKGIFNAPDAVVALAVDCTTPPMAHVAIRNIGAAGLPAGVEADVYDTATNTKVGAVTTTYALFPGQTQTLSTPLVAPATSHGTFVAKIYVDPTSPKFHECRTDNDTSNQVTPSCVQ